MAKITIADIRSKYPQYNDLSDQKLADGLYEKYYSDMPKQDFYDRIGFADLTTETAPADPRVPDQTGGFSDQLLAAMGPAAAPVFSSSPQASLRPKARPATPGTPGPLPDGAPVLRPPLPDALLQAMAGHEAAPQIDMARPASPPVRPREGDNLLFGMMGGASPEMDAWARREIVRQAAERGEALVPPQPGPRPQPAPTAQPAKADPFAGEGTGAPVNKPGTVLSRTATATGQALRNVPENLLTGWYGMKLAGAELGQEVSPTDIAAQMQGATELAAVEEQMAAMKTAMDRSPREAAALQSQYLDLAQRRGQLRELYGAAADTIASEAAQLSRFEAAGQAARARISDLDKTKVQIDAEPGSPEYYVSAAIGSAAEMAPALAASAIMRNPAPAMVFMGGYAGGTSYIEGRKQGLSPHDARGYATLYAAAEGIPEALPVHILLKPGQKFLTRLISGAAAEGAQEMITEALQIGIDKGYVSPDMTWAEARQRIADAGIIGTLAGGTMGAAVGGVDASINLRNRDRREKDDAVGQRPAPAVATPSPPAQPPAPAADPLLLAMGQRVDQPKASREKPAEPEPQAAPEEKLPEASRSQSESQTYTDVPQGTSRDDEAGFEILDEVETVDGETRPTGRKVRVNLETGEASVVDANEAAGEIPAGAPAARGTQPESQPQEPGAPIGAGAQQTGTAAGGARPAPQRKFLSHDETVAIETDPKTFQYKGGADTEGVTNALQGVTRFDPNRAGQVVLFETKDGRTIVADGHQRTGLARRMAASGQQDVDGMAAVVYREADGYTPEEVMALAALKNIGEGSGTAVDAARVLRNRSDSIEDLGLPPQSALVRTAEGLRRLSDQAFGMVVNGRASERDGAIVGRVVTNRDAQLGILGLLSKLNPANAFQAEAIARQAAEEVTTETQSSLFGDEEIAANLYLERAKVLDNAVKRLNDEKRLFGTLTDRIEAITSAGNVLAKDENARRVDAAARMRDYLTSQANVKGPISEALSASARDIKAGRPVGEATGRFLEALKREIEGVGGRGEAAPGGRSVDQGESPRESRQDEVSPPPDDLLATMGVKPDPTTRPEPKPAPEDGGDLLAMMGAKPQKNPEPAARAEAEAKVKAAQSKKGTTTPQGDAGPLFDTQGDIEKAAAKPGGLDLIQRGREILAPYARRNDGPFDSKAGTDLRDLTPGVEVANRIAAATTMAAKIAAAEAWIAKMGKQTGIEHMVALDPDGVPLAIMSGHQSGVSFHTAVWRAGADGKIAVSVHNHPSSNGASAADIAILALWPKHRMVIVSHNGERHELSATEAFAMRPDEDRPYLTMGAIRDEIEVGWQALRGAVNKAAWDVAKKDGSTDGGLGAFTIAMRPVFGLALERAGLVRYKDSVAWRAKFDAAGLNFEDIYGQVSGTLADRLGRAGFDVSKVGDRRRDQAAGSGADAAPSRTDRPDREPAPDGERGDRGGRVPPPDEVAPDDFDAALDAVFGKPEPAKRSASDIAKDLGDLFSEPPSGFREDGIDPDRYARAVPLFTEALAGVDMAAMPRKDVFVAMIRPLAAAGLKREAVAKMRPYFDRFLGDLDSGRITLGKEASDAPGTSGNLERDRGDAGSQDRVGKADVPAPGRGDGTGAGTRGAAPDGRGELGPGGERLPSDDAASVGTGRDQGIQGDRRTRQQPADDRDGAGSGDAGQPGIPDDYSPAGVTGETARNAPDLKDRVAAQRAADERARRGIRLADETSVRDTLPLLKPEQQDDVVKIERRFLKPDGHGMLLTNGTGTGKTYSGGGVVKRFAQAGKTEILILAPSQGILDHWIDALHDLGLSATKLESTTSAGKGIVVTTYANAGMNNALAGRKWDLIVSDEAHRLSQNAAGDATAALDTLRAISHRPADLWRKSQMLHADEWAKLKAMKDGEAKTAEAHRLFRQKDAEVAAFAKEPRAKVLFLSATPFAYDKNIDYADGYLFDYPADGHVGNSRQSGQNLFMVQNFGYRIRYHKLTKPDANVDGGVFEREFHEKLRREGVLSGRHLDIEPDYERRFVQRDDAQGSQIDGILDFIREQAHGKGPDKDAYSALLRSINKNFNYLRRMQLLEAIKAKAAQPDIDKHLALGRKVVIFHDYNVGGGFNPFRPGAGPDGPADQAAYEGYAALIAAKPEAENLNFTGYLPPVEELKRAYGKRAVVYNGTIPTKDRAKAKKDFNTDGSGIDIMIVQSAAGEAGISLHDITGGHQRALINLGMPTRPTTALQEEGRIRREGSVSDALFHYYTIGTTWERQAFARKIAERSGTVENLALGNEARMIRDSFIEAYEDASPWEPGETDGKGGKERDRAVAKASPYEIAKTHYFGRMKSKGRRDQREGIDFYATPEPLGFKMVEWAGIRPYERVLEPSAGDGSIARYFPEHSDRTIVEPSADLMSRAQLRAVGAKGVQGRFEDYHIVNKHHVVVMNPPFGQGGKTAMEHLAKAAKHLRPGGRIVALIPTGPAADARFDKWWDSDDSMGLVRSAEVALPAVTFEKAGTSIAAKVVILDKIPSPSDRDAQREMTGGTKRINMTGASTIGEFFDRLEGISAPDRPVQQRDAADEIMDEEEAANPPMAAPERPAAPLHGTDQEFTLGETTHGKTGEKLWVATATKRVDDAAWKATVAVAKRHGGWFSSFRGRGAIPGYQFKTEAARQAFLDDMKKPTVGFEQPSSPFRRPVSLDRAIIGGDLGTLSSHPDYEAAKAGDVASAVRVAQDLVTDELVRQVSDMIGDSEPIIVPVISVEASGRNKIPLAAAEALAAKLDLETADGIGQTNSPQRTALSGLDRIFASPAFDGPVTAGQDYLLLDDTVTQGGTFAALASHIQTGGGNVVGAVALTGKQYSAILRPSPETLSALREKHGDLENDFRAATGYGFDALTESEARYLTNFKPADAIRVRIVDAGRQGRQGENQEIDRPDLDGFEDSEEQFQPQPAEVIREMMPALRAELDRLGLKRVRLFHDEKNMLDLPEGTQGMFLRNPHGGMAIVVAASLDPMKTIHHEVIHALRSMNLFTPEEWRALEIKAARTWVAQFDIVERYPGLLPSEQIEEAIAEAFAEAAATKKSPTGSLLVRASNKIARFLKALANVLRSAGFQTAEDVFGSVLAGQLTRRNAGNTGAAAAFQEDGKRQSGSPGTVGPEVDAKIKATLANEKLDAPIIIPKSPKVIAAILNKDVPVVLPQSVIWKANSDKHGLTEAQIVAAVHGLDNPVVVFDSATQADSLVALVDVAGVKGSVVVALRINDKVGRVEISRVVSIHDRPDGQILNWMGQGLTRYVNGSLTDAWRRSRGLHLPKDGTTKHRLGKKILRHRDVFKGGPGFEAPSPRFQAALVPSRQARAHMATAMGGNAAFIPDRRIWEELTAAGRPIWARLREGLGAANDAIDKARIRLQDRFLPVLRAQEAVMRATGANLPADHNAYITETTFSGKVGRHLFEIDEDYTKPIIARIAATKGGLTADYVGEWLTARHAIERNAHIASINPKMPDGGSGMTDADAQAILAAAAAGPYAQTLQEIGDLIDRLRERTLTLREDAGLITHAEANLWRKQYKFYVPLKGFAETDHSEAVLDLTGVGRRFNVRGGESQRALGRRSEAFNPLQAAITQAQEVAIRAERNRVGQPLYNLAKDFPSPALWSVKKVATKRYYNRTTGLVETRAEDPVSLFMDPNEMAVKVGGEEYRVVFHDPRLARAAGSVGADQMGWFLSMMSVAARYFSSINTMLDPEFVIRNAFRDMTAAQINIRNFGEADRNYIAKAMLKNWPKAFVGAFRGMGNKADSKWTRLYREFEQSGAKVSFWKLEQPEAGKADLDKRIRLAGGSRLGPASRFIRLSTRDNPVLGFIERTNLAVDNAVRLAAYVAARDRGWEKPDAAALAKNLTVNFNRRGEWGSTINALYPFANASIQGTQILFRAMTSKRMAKYGIGLVALGIIMDMVNAGLSEEDDDGELAYDKIADWKNRTNLMVMLGPDAGEAATIWLPYGYSLFPYLGQQIGKVGRGVKEPGAAMADFAAAMFGAFSPIQGEDFQATLTPTMLDPINEMAMNEDWLGRPIRPENAYADYGPDAYKFYAGATETSKQLADIMNRATGGTEAESGAIDVSPEYIDHMFGFLTGGAGRTVGRSADIVAKSVTGNFEEIELRDVPVARSLVYDTGDWLDRDRYYRFRDEVKEAHASAKIYGEAGKKVPKHIARIDALYGDMLAAEKALRSIRKQGGGDQARVMMAFNKRFVRVAGQQGE